ncbi:hypothetical protein [Pontibacter cellulosilyticus]|uniref:Uncharacterized protein n=1 Tax=Pontibacter cellulosilyticus TaxID=1720253 RepID=A0A923N5W5_9BACT|nr:hypothetical protein [Pontibacter cellulosilyticus]MBC5992399.1 hypothetical protein [Pontibacter cellulosilyticus]
MEKTLNIGSIASSLFGLIAIAIGIINMFWGNDPFYGIFIFLLALVYFPPVAAFVERIVGRPIPLLAKVLLGAFILWTALGVGELFDKIELMLKNF